MVDKGYGVTSDSVELVPGADEALRMVSQIRLPVVIVTNQSGIARGLTTPAVVQAVNDRLIAELKERRIEVLGVMVCPHAPEAQCRCRKPEPGLFQEAARLFRIALPASYMVGDKLTDRQSALRAGIQQTFQVDASTSLTEVIRHIKNLTRGDEAIL